MVLNYEIRIYVHIQDERIIVNFGLFRKNNSSHSKASRIILLHSPFSTDYLSNKTIFRLPSNSSPSAKLLFQNNIAFSIFLFLNVHHEDVFLIHLFYLLLFIKISLIFIRPILIHQKCMISFRSSFLTFYFFLVSIKLFYLRRLLILLYLMYNV